MFLWLNVPHHPGVFGLPGVPCQSLGTLPPFVPGPGVSYCSGTPGVFLAPCCLLLYSFRTWQTCLFLYVILKPLLSDLAKGWRQGHGPTNVGAMAKKGYADFIQGFQKSPVAVDSNERGPGPVSVSLSCWHMCCYCPVSLIRAIVQFLCSRATLSLAVLFCWWCAMG